MTDHGLDVWMLMAAVFGAVAYIARDQTLTPVRGLLMLFSAVPLAIYTVGPALDVARLWLPEEFAEFFVRQHWRVLMAFALAFFGIPLGDALLCWFKAKRDKIINSVRGLTK